MKLNKKWWVLVELEEGDDGGINDAATFHRTKEEALDQLADFQRVAPEIYLCQVEFNALEKYTRQKV